MRRQNVVEADGGVYPCDFYVLDGYCLGNLNQCGFDEIEAKREALGFVEESKAVDADCRDCPWAPFAGGAANAIGNPGGRMEACGKIASARPIRNSSPMPSRGWSRSPARYPKGWREIGLICIRVGSMV